MRLVRARKGRRSVLDGDRGGSIPWRRARRRLLGAGSAVGLLVGLVGAMGSGAASAAGSGSPITICEITALSGSFSTFGVDDSYGAEAYVKMANANGGMSGHPVTIIQENDQSVPALAATLARKCVDQDHANFVFGPEETSTAAAAVPVLNSLKVLSIGWESGWNDIGLSAADRHSYAFPGVENNFHEFDLDAIELVAAPRHYTRAAVIETSSPGGLGNNTFVASVGKQYGLKVVATQITPPGSTDDTPAALALLAAKPQIVILGLTPGPDSITGIRAIRAQDPTIPIADCAGCNLPSFVNAVGGTSVLQNVYMFGSNQDVLANLPRTPANMATIDDMQRYVTAMKAAGLGSPDDINAASDGWQSSESLAAAIQAAGGSIKTADVIKALEQQKLDTVGVEWDRTAANHGGIVSVESAMDIITPSGQTKVFGLARGGAGE
jgi:ABC-type branched-subunit amino acid transport system substrate-binding protein